MRILFMGTPDIAASCLARLIDDEKNIIGVVSQPDKPKGRGYTLTPPPVKVLAEKNGIPVYQPTTLRDGEFYKTLCELSPDLIAVVAYGKILPKEIIDYPKYGCINVHASLLPKYRGAAPMQRAIMNGEKETGVTIMYMDEGLDTGDMLFCESFPIEKNDNFESVHDKTAELGARMLSTAIDKIAKGEIERKKQNDSLATYAAKIEKEECLIDFKKSAEELDCFIRGLSPIPLAYAIMPDGKKLKLATAYPVDKRGEVGAVLECDDKKEGRIVIACKEGALAVTSVLPEGKGKMSAADFIRGRKISVGDILSGKN
ncbi:MAG: methionyl-tRNA formyltransferase [Clostridia bacterium]|nr:methionyl-tRNA formyltransferase [Clostridia bacterium]